MQCQFESSAEVLESRDSSESPEWSVRDDLLGDAPVTGMIILSISISGCRKRHAVSELDCASPKNGIQPGSLFYVAQ